MSAELQQLQLSTQFALCDILKVKATLV